MKNGSPEQQLQTRRRFVAYFSGIGLSSTLLPGVLWAKLQEEPAPTITVDMVKNAAIMAGLDFTAKECEMLVDDVNKNLTRFETIHQTHSRQQRASLVATYESINPRA